MCVIALLTPRTPTRSGISSTERREDYIAPTSSQQGAHVIEDRATRRSLCAARRRAVG
jgi:hypothetical protein